MGLAEPCITCEVVTPPASARYSSTSNGSSTSPTPTSAVTGFVASLMLLMAMCECASMMPGITYMSVASYTSTPSGASRSGPISAIVPSRTRMSVSSRMPFVMVSTVPPWIRRSSGPAAGDWACTGGASSPVIHSVVASKTARERFQRGIVEKSVMDSSSKSRRRALPIGAGRALGGEGHRAKVRDLD